ncbi:DUF3014 domain-containing protein [Litorilituus lipolyticus]|uniref:DUF3014 domain-containing protein n=1 Tax=Litorilituus lipolyticus TaxID=2491017 RepID=A0A502L7X2_9GAMM|nr:DUF3014 domain-containing protein [Litorilituus lipolyticus]TPH19164.1 DUF3014 domain-containing protein [Litorilituus lipolyticus]
MENSNVSSKQVENEESGNNEKNTGPLLLFVAAFVLVVIAIWQFPEGKVEKRTLEMDELIKQEDIVIREQPKEEVVEDSLAPIEDEVVLQVPEVVIEEVVIEQVEEPVIEEVNPLPELNESDSWLQVKLPELTWRKELLKLVIDEDMIRRFVVFTDNFAQGTVAYEHSPFVLPNTKFSPDEETVAFQDNQNVWLWNESSSKRFNLYVDLLRSIDSASLVEWYFEIKPLVDEAYQELGYEDDFTIVLQEAITNVLDMELPKEKVKLIQPSVMYKFHDQSLEELNDSDKLLLRLGKENLLIIKSILLEINEKIAQQHNGIE